MLTTHTPHWQHMLLTGLLAMGVTTCGSSKDSDNTTSSSAVGLSSASVLASSSSSLVASSSSSLVASSSSSPVASSSVVASSSSVAAMLAPNLLTSDGSFDGGKMNFSYNKKSGTDAWDGEFFADIPSISKDPWDEQLMHEIKLIQGQAYTICFKAKGKATRNLVLNIDTGEDGALPLLGPWSSNIGGEIPISLTTTYQSFVKKVTAAATDATARLTFNLGQSDVGVSFDDVGVFEGSECGDFAAAPVEGTPPIALAVTGLVGSVEQGKTEFDTQCKSCHMADGTGSGANPALNTHKVIFRKDGETKPYSMEMYIANFMPKGNSAECGEQCAADVTAYIKAGFAVPTKATCGTDMGVVCDDFEGASINARWTKVGSAALSSEEKHSGTQSLKVTGTGGGANFNGVDLDLTQFASLTKNHYGRLMLKTPAVATDSGDFTFVEAVGPANLLATSRLTESNNAMYRARVHGEAESFMANYDTSPYASPLTDCYNHGSEVAVPKDTWACFEWRFDATSNTLSYWLNGTQLNMSVKDKVGTQCAGHILDDIWSGPSSFTKLHVGIDQYHATSLPRTLYVDDIVVDTQRVNCPQ